MKAKCTYLDLLLLVKEGKQPERVRMLGQTYEWDGIEYVWDVIHGVTLGEHIKEWTTQAQVTAEMIEVIE